MLGRFKVEGNMNSETAALLAMCVAQLVHEKPVHTGAQKSTQAAFGGIIRTEKLFFQETRKKLLGKILGVFTLQPPAETDIFIDRAPVGGSNGIHGADALLRITALRGSYHGVPCQWKFVALWTG